MKNVKKFLHTKVSFITAKVIVVLLTTVAGNFSRQRNFLFQLNILCPAFLTATFLSVQMLSLLSHEQLHLVKVIINTLTFINNSIKECMGRHMDRTKVIQ